jgi:FkbM family methyltransferase
MNEIAKPDLPDETGDTTAPTGQPELEALLRDTQRSLRDLTIAARLMALGPDRMLPVFFRDNVIRVHVPYADFDEGQQRLVLSSKLEDDLAFLQLSEYGIIRPGSTLVVGGGYIGASTVALADMMDAGKVHVFEPQACLAAPLERTLAENGLAKAQIHADVLAEADTEIALGTQKPNRLYDTVYLARRGGKVPSIALDAANIKDIGLLFLCYRGSKIPALRGAEQTIRDQSPVIVCDKLGRDLSEIGAFLGELGYSAQILDGRLCLYVREAG